MNQSKILVLVIDDDELSSAFARKALEQAGYSVESCKDALSGMISAVKNKPNLIILDLVMEGVSGLDFLEKRKSLERIKEIPVLVSSGRDDLETAQTAFGLGASDYLIKPFDPPVLLKKIARLLKDPSFLVYDLPESIHTGTLHLRCEITGINEAGFRLNAPIRVAPGGIVRLKSKFLESLGVFEYPLRVISSKFFETPRKHYSIEVVIFGIKEGTAKKIRSAIRRWK